MSENKNIINEQEPQDDHMIEGRNAVLEAFRAGKTIDKLYIQDGLHDGVISSILRDAKKKDVIVNFVSKEKLDQMSPDRKHQGVMAITAAFSYAEVDDILEKAKEKGEDPFIFILDEIEDPHNLGAIIRTANLCGAHGVIIPTDCNGSQGFGRCNPLYTSCQGDKYCQDNRRTKGKRPMVCLR